MRLMPHAPKRRNMNSPTVVATSPSARNLSARIIECQSPTDLVRRRACCRIDPPQIDRVERAADRDGRGPVIEAVDVSTYVIPTDALESDGTFAWDRTTLVVVEITAGGVRGLGYTYAAAATAAIVRETLAKLVLGADVFAIPAMNARMFEAIRNLG